MILFLDEAQPSALSLADDATLDHPVQELIRLVTAHLACDETQEIITHPCPITKRSQYESFGRILDKHSRSTFQRLYHWQNRLHPGRIGSILISFGGDS